MMSRVALACLAGICLLAAAPTTSAGDHPTHPPCKRIIPDFTLHVDESFTIKTPHLDITYIHKNEWHDLGEGNNLGESAKVLLHPGHGTDIHKHAPGVAEWIFVISGKGTYEVLAPGMLLPEVKELTPGVVASLPPGSIHKTTAARDSHLEALVWTSSGGLFDIELFQEWPKTVNEDGEEPPVFPWDEVCPPYVDHAAHDEL